MMGNPAPTIRRSTHTAACKKLYDSSNSDSDNEMVIKSLDTVNDIKDIEKTTNTKVAAITPNPPKRRSLPSP
eukprot:2611740-Ditylum_brightwellii.AAC.1